MHGPPPLSAPDLIGPVSILNWPISGASQRRKGPPRPFRHALLEIRLRSSSVQVSKNPILRGLEEALHAAPVVESGAFGRRVVAALHGLSARGFRTVARWQIHPRDILPAPDTNTEPVSQLLDALMQGGGSGWAKAARFEAELLDGSGNRAAITLQRLHRQGTPGVVLELTGSIPPDDLHAIVGALAQRLPLASSHLVRYTYGAARSR